MQLQLKTFLSINRLLVMLTCVHKQARQGTDQLQGQDGQNEVQVPCAGLREGVLQAEEEEECRAACREEMCTAGAQPGSRGPSHHRSRSTTRARSHPFTQQDGS